MTQDIKPLNQKAADKAIMRIKSLLPEDLTYVEMCDILNEEGYRTIRNCEWTPINLRVVIYRLRHELASYYAVSAQRARLTRQVLAA